MYLFRGWDVVIVVVSASNGVLCSSGKLRNASRMGWVFVWRWFMTQQLSVQHYLKASNVLAAGVFGADTFH